MCCSLHEDNEVLSDQIIAVTVELVKKVMSVCLADMTLLATCRLKFN